MPPLRVSIAQSGLSEPYLSETLCPDLNCLNLKSANLNCPDLNCFRVFSTSAKIVMTLLPL